MASLIVAAWLAATPIKLASPGFSVLGLPDAAAQFYSDHFAARFAGDERFEVVTRSDIVAVLAVERQKALLGCESDQASCMAELAGALGVEGIITGQVARVSDAFQLNVRVISASSRALFTHSSALLGSEKELIEELNRTAQQARERLATDLRAATPTAASSSRLPPVLTLAAGAALAATGIAFLGDAAQKYSSLNKPTNWPSYDLATATDLADRGKTSQTVGAVLLSVGLAALAAGVIWLILVSR